MRKLITREDVRRIIARERYKYKKMLAKEKESAKNKMEQAMTPKSNIGKFFHDFAITLDRF